MVFAQSRFWLAQPIITRPDAAANSNSLRAPCALFSLQTAPEAFAVNHGGHRAFGRGFEGCPITSEVIRLGKADYSFNELAE